MESTLPQTSDAGGGPAPGAVADPALNLAAPTLPQAENGTLDLLNLRLEGVTVRLSYDGQRDGDTITARVGDHRQIKVVDGSNLDYPAFDVKFPVGEIKVGRYEVGYTVESILGVITPSATLFVDVIDSADANYHPGPIYWSSTTGAPNLDLPGAYPACNRLALQGNPDRLLLIADLSEGVKVGAGIAPQFASAPESAVRLDNGGRATLWVTRESSDAEGRATFTLADQETPSDVTYLEATFGPWKPINAASLEMAIANGAPPDGITPCSIYLKNVSTETKRVNVFFSDAWIDVAEPSFTVEPGGVHDVQVTSVIPSSVLVQLEIQGDGVEFYPVRLEFSSIISGR